MMSKLLLFVSLLVAVCQGHNSPFDDWCSRWDYAPYDADPMEYYECEWIPDNHTTIVHLRHCPEEAIWSQKLRKCQMWDTVCPVDGYIAHPTDPTAYFQCETIAGQGWHLLLKQCPNKTFWSASNKQCESTATDFYCWMGYMPHETDPHEYYQCQKGPQGWITTLMHCPAQTTWVQSHWRCD
ncbi:unnamed protein product, partial [Oppiella nova]